MYSLQSIRFNHQGTRYVFVGIRHETLWVETDVGLTTLPNATVSNLDPSDPVDTLAEAYHYRSLHINRYVERGLVVLNDEHDITRNLLDEARREVGIKITTAREESEAAQAIAEFRKNRAAFLAQFE